MKSNLSSNYRTAIICAKAVLIQTDTGSKVYVPLGMYKGLLVACDETSTLIEWPKREVLTTEYGMLNRPAKQFDIEETQRQLKNCRFADSDVCYVIPDVPNDFFLMAAIDILGTLRTDHEALKYSAEWVAHPILPLGQKLSGNWWTVYFPADDVEIVKNSPLTKYLQEVFQHNELRLVIASRY